MCIGRYRFNGATQGKCNVVFTQSHRWLVRLLVCLQQEYITEKKVSNCVYKRNHIKSSSFIGNVCELLHSAIFMEENFDRFGTKLAIHENFPFQ